MCLIAHRKIPKSDVVLSLLYSHVIQSLLYLHNTDISLSCRSSSSKLYKEIIPFDNL